MRKLMQWNSKFIKSEKTKELHKEGKEALVPHGSAVNDSYAVMKCNFLYSNIDLLKSCTILGL